VIYLRRKYKLVLIILISVIVAYFIYFFNHEDKIYLVALGDGIASGETSYNIDGISYNDYMKEYYDSHNLLKKYNNSFSYKNYKINDLINDIDNNILDKKNDINIKQIIHKANIITIAVGEDELTKLAITNDLNEEYIKSFISKYDILLQKLVSITESKIAIIGLYENKYLSKSNVIILNSEIANIVSKYNMIFINVSDLMMNKEYYLNKNSYYFSYKGHESIADIIIHSL